MILFSNFGFRGFENVSLTPKIKKETGEESKSQNVFTDPLQQPSQDLFKKSSRHLNDFDTNIFVIPENMLPDDSLRLGIKIDKAEKNLKELNSQIDAIKALEIEENSERLAKLEEKKLLLNQEIQDYRDEYKSLGLMYQVSDIFCDVVNKSKDKYEQAKVAFTSNSAILKLKTLIPGMKQKEELSTTLDKFCKVQANLSGMLSKSVNPFLDAENKMNDIVAMMTVANKLDVQSNRVLNSFKTTKSKMTGLVVSVRDKIKSKFVAIREKTKEFIEKIIPKQEATEVVQDVKPVEEINIFEEIKESGA